MLLFFSRENRYNFIGIFFIYMLGLDDHEIGSHAFGFSFLCFLLSPADIFDAEMSDENEENVKENKTDEV